MRVLLTSHGSTGDIVPMISLGRALCEAGHQIAFATTPFFKDDIEAAGVDFLPLPPFDWGAPEFAEAMKSLHRAKNPLRQLHFIYGNARPYFDENLRLLDSYLEGADILVGSYLFPSFSGLAERRGAKFAVVSFCHNMVASVDYPPPTLPALNFLPGPLRRGWNRFCWNISERVLDSVMEQELGEPLRRAGLPMQKGFCWAPAPLALVAVSPALMQPKGAAISPCFRYTGYLRYQRPDDPAFEETLQAFTGGEHVPVVTFGSVTWDQAQEAMRTFLQTWPRGKKLILQAGWANFKMSEASEWVLKVQKCSHDQLFRHASVVMHHGGAGTTASALHAGAPQLVAPQIADQNFWAAQVQRLGVGLRASPQGWPTQAPRLIGKLEADTAYARRARECAEVLATENGPAEAVTALEALAQN